jgi:hypothetical protein
MGWLITASTTAFVATLCVTPEDRSCFFWHRVSWTEFLILLFWGSCALYLLVPAVSNDARSRIGGIALTIPVVTAAYVAVSFVALVVHAYVPESSLATRVHWIFQLVSVALFALTTVVLFVARAGAEVRVGITGPKSMSPQQLAELLAVHESPISGDAGSSSARLSLNIAKLRETLVHSLHDSGSLAGLPEYQLLCAEIREFCVSLGECAGTKASNQDCHTRLIDTAGRIAIRIKETSSKQVRR